MDKGKKLKKGEVGTSARSEAANTYGKPPHPPTKIPGAEVLRVINGYCQALRQYDTLPLPKNTFGHPVTYYTFPDSIFSKENPPYHFMVEMAGFLDDEIYFEFDSKALYILGYRSDREGVCVRSMTETCIMPPGMFAENTKISRDTKGTLWVEGRYVE